MNDARDLRAKEIQDGIREVLYRDWDPLNVCGAGPKDEYDSYVGTIYRVLASSPSREAVARELLKIERESIGFDRVKEEALFSVADKLLQIDLKLAR
jgi:IS30 family transposase